MFDSLTHWFESLREQGHLFEHPDDGVLQVALASVLYHLMQADGQVDRREKHEFERFMRQELDLDDERIEALYRAAKASNSDLHGDLHTINFHLKHNPGARLRFMQKLLPMIEIHGTTEAEMSVFFETLHEVFPELKDLGGDDNL